VRILVATEVASEGLNLHYPQAPLAFSISPVVDAPAATTNGRIRPLRCQSQPTAIPLQCSPSRAARDGVMREDLRVLTARTTRPRRTSVIPFCCSCGGSMPPIEEEEIGKAN